jgi:hypothetical protein
MSQASQVPTVAVSSAWIMRHRAFRLGLEDVRTGRVRFDDPCAGDTDWAWNYERGRLFGCLAPVTMSLFVGGKLNPIALALFKLASERRLIT